MLWVDTIFLITFPVYMVRISHWKSMFKTGGKQQCHSNPFCLEIDDTMYVVSFMYHQTLISHLPIISAARDPPGTPQQRVTYMDTM